MSRIFQQSVLKTNRCGSILCFVFVGCLLLVGCAAPAHLAQKSEPTQDEKIQQTMDRWKGTHISKAIQKWDSPSEVRNANDGMGGKTYTWIVPVQEFLVGPEVHISEFQPRHHASSMRASRRENLSKDHTFKIVFYTRPDGVIYKAYIRK